MMHPPISLLILRILFTLPLALGLETVMLMGAIAPAIADYTPVNGGSAPRSGSTVVNSIRVNPTRYVPPNGGTAPRTSTGTNGVRGSGCSAADSTGLVPLAPLTHVGQTTMTQPTLAWFSSERGSYQVQLAIAQHPNAAQIEAGETDNFTVVYATEFDLTEHLQVSGISAFDLSKTEVQLEPNTYYRWQVVIICNPNRPSESLVTDADILVVDAPTPLRSALATITDPIERVDRYGAAGFWYDAMGEALASYDAGGKASQIDLLADLATIEAQDTQATSHTDDAQEEGSSDPAFSFSTLLDQVVALLR